MSNQYIPGTWTANTTSCPVCGCGLPTSWSTCPNCASSGGLGQFPGGIIPNIKPNIDPYVWGQRQYYTPNVPLSPDARVAILWEGPGGVQVMEFPSTEAALERIRELQTVVHSPIKLLEVTHIWNPGWKHEEVT